MSSDILRSVEEQQLKEDIGVRSDLQRLRVGDDVQVHFRIVEGERERIQLVRGTVMRLRQGGGANANFTVRRVASHGIGVERSAQACTCPPGKALLPARQAGKVGPPEREAVYAQLV